MKAYLITTGVLFGLMSLIHVWRAIDEWPKTMNIDFILLMAALVAIPGLLSCWAWRLLWRLTENTTKAQ